MSINDTYQPINCDDYDNLELACQHHLMLTLELKDGEKLQAKASDLVSRKNVEYLVV
ncbi:Rho-binding antiterminator, partial [Escherichia coli]